MDIVNERDSFLTKDYSCRTWNSNVIFSFNLTGYAHLCLITKPVTAVLCSFFMIVLLMQKKANTLGFFAFVIRMLQLLTMISF